MLTLTTGEASQAITIGIVVSILLAMICIVFIISIIQLKRKIAQSKSN